jgi:hypothetical protein
MTSRSRNPYTSLDSSSDRPQPNIDDAVEFLTPPSLVIRLLGTALKRATPTVADIDDPVQLRLPFGEDDHKG